MCLGGLGFDKEGLFSFGFEKLEWRSDDFGDAENQ